MEYKKGYTIKPKQVNEDGIVIFTNGTNDTAANEDTCTAYGYKFDKITGTCYSFRPSLKLIKAVAKIGSLYLGRGNKIGIETKGSFAAGENNEIDNNINNATALGKGGKAIRQGEVVIGGGSTAGFQQMSIVQMSAITTDNTTTDMNTMDGSSVITCQNNSIVGLEIYLTRLETGGSSGTAGNYSYRRQQSCIQVGRSGALGIVNFNTKNIAKVGVNGTFAIASSEDGFTIQVSDRNNVDNTWHAIVYIHETKTNITF